MSPSLPRNRDAIALLAFALTGVAAIGVGIARADFGGEPDPSGPVASAPASVEAASPSPVSTPTSTPGVAATTEPVVVPESEPADEQWRVPDESVAQAADVVVEELAPDAGPRTPLSVLSVRDVDGDPELFVEEVRGRAAAVEAVEEAQRADGVVAVSLDAPVRLLAGEVHPAADQVFESASEGDQWALTKLDATASWGLATGEGVTVAVVDTGVDASHPDLAGRVLTGTDFVEPAEGEAVTDGTVDPNGHGTHVAGIIASTPDNGFGTAGLAPAAHIAPVRVLNAEGDGWASDVAAGVDWATEHGADVINLSLGTSTPVAALETMIEAALDAGVVVVAASGNEAASAVSYPAAQPRVIAVGSTNSDDTLSSFSNKGAALDVVAPGSAIVSTWPGNRYALLDGTSMATPYAAATAALALDVDGSLTPADVADLLTAAAFDLGDAGRDDSFGYGRIDPHETLLAVTAPATSSPTPTPTPTSDPTPTLPPTPTPTAPAPGGGGGGGAAPAPEPTPTPTPTPTPSPSPEPEPIEEPRTDPTPEQPTAQEARLSFVATPGRARVGQRRPVRVRLETVDGQALAGQDVVVLAWREGRIAARRVVTTDAGGVATAYFPITATTRFTARSLAGDEAARDVADRATRWVATPRFRLGHAGGRASVRLVDDRGQRVLVQVRRGARWVTVRRPRLTDDGRVVVRGLRFGTYRVRITAVPGLAATVSRVWKVR